MLSFTAKIDKRDGVHKCTNVQIVNSFGTDYLEFDYGTAPLFKGFSVKRKKLPKVGESFTAENSVRSKLKFTVVSTSY